MSSDEKIRLGGNRDLTSDTWKPVREPMQMFKREMAQV